MTGTLYPADPAVAARVDALMDQTKDATMGRMVGGGVIIHAQKHALANQPTF